ncbi:MAG: DUF2179 domain-containing protein [Bacteroidales bacterium]|jgi:uncharacterized protein YebE (UPF0316 family)|nr:DUF2179 domain-containing protein [Bacteroidales bacterium]
MEFLNNDIFDLVLLPLAIFVARIADVSLGTLRIIFVSKGMKTIAPLIGFVEVLIWIIAISRIMQNLDNWLCYIAYAAGFATGTYVGLIIEEKLAIGHEMVRVITKRDASELVDKLKSEGYGVTSVDATGAEGEVGVLYIIVRRSMIDKVLKYINSYNPRALYTIEAIKYVNKEIFHKAYEPKIRIPYSNIRK